LSVWTVIICHGLGVNILSCENDNKPLVSKTHYYVMCCYWVVQWFSVAFYHLQTHNSSAQWFMLQSERLQHLFLCDWIDDTSSDVMLTENLKTNCATISFL